MKKLRLLSLFAGIGGFELGLERSGYFETVAQCEIDPFCRRVLAKHWPDVPRYEDVRTLTAARLAADGIAIDAICGGFPCQDISSAGRGIGLGGARSGLWYEFDRLIGELRPHFVIVENVGALLHRGLDAVLGRLSERGYDAEWENIPASAVGAPHRRERFWIVAYPAEKQPTAQIHGRHLQEGRREWEECLPPNLLDAIRGHVRAPDSYHIRDYDGLPAFVGVLGACGNAVVPQIPKLIGRAIGRALEAQREAA